MNSGDLVLHQQLKYPVGCRLILRYRYLFSVIKLYIEQSLVIKAFANIFDRAVFYAPKSYYQRQPLIVRIRDFEKRTEPDVITALFELIITIAKLITGNNVQKRDYRPVSPELRAEIQNLDRTLEEYHFLRDHNVECTEDFLVCRSEIKEQIKNYEAERQHIRNQIRRAKTPKEDYSLKEKSREITKKLTPLRKQLIICGRIENKAPLLRALIEQEKQLEQGRYKYKYYQQTKSKQRSYER